MNTQTSKALWNQVCNTVLVHNPDWIKLLLDWKDAEQEELKHDLRKYQKRSDELLTVLRDLLEQAAPVLEPGLPCGPAPCCERAREAIGAGEKICLGCGRAFIPRIAGSVTCPKCLAGLKVKDGRP